MISFFKYQAAGNDFILIDDRKGSFPVDNSSYISTLCTRKWGIGADGLILLQPSSKKHFRMRIFNSDGKEAASCGNGLCCLARFLTDLGHPPKVYEIEMMKSTAKITFVDGSPAVFFEPPKHLKKSLSIPLSWGKETVHFIDTGVPHAVLFVQDAAQEPVLEKGKEIRWHPSFQPEGANVNFVQKLLDGSIRVRTYERGVEDETLACGTGAAATALMAHEILSLASPISIHFPGGKLLVSFEKGKEGFKNVLLINPASQVFSGSI